MDMREPPGQPWKEVGRAVPWPNQEANRRVSHSRGNAVSPLATSTVTKKNQQDADASDGFGWFHNFS